MSKHARDRRPYVKPVTRMELSESNIKLRWIAVAVLLAIAVVALGYGISVALSTEPGWQEVSANPDTVNCAQDFVLMYDFSAEGINATVENKRLETLYTQLTEDAYSIFSPEAEVEGLNNLHYLNAHVNETVTVIPELYEALELAVRYESRYLFLAPVNDLYEPVFLSEGDGEAEAFDPMKDAQRMRWVQEAAAYAADPEMIRLELLGENQVRLVAAEEYLAYAEAEEIGILVDFGWLRNAFIIDYMADKLTQEGCTFGYLASYDGFTRNLDTRGNSYTVNLFDRQGSDILMPANFTYTSPASIVYLRDYPLSEEDRWHYYGYESGDITTIFLDPADGVSKAAVDSLTGYSTELGCAEILLQLAPVFTADTLKAEELIVLASAGIETIWFEETVLYHTEADPFLQILTESGGQGYGLACVTNQ